MKSFAHTGISSKRNPPPERRRGLAQDGDLVLIRESIFKAAGRGHEQYKVHKHAMQALSPDAYSAVVEMTVRFEDPMLKRARGYEEIILVQYFVNLLHVCCCLTDRLRKERPLII